MPEFCTEEMLVWLDDLREEGSVNMFGAGAPLARAFPELSADEARAVHVHWMESFGDRHPREEK